MQQAVALDARIRAALLYDKQNLDRNRALELYREITTHETDPKRLQEAQKRLSDLGGGKYQGSLAGSSAMGLGLVTLAPDWAPTAPWLWPRLHSRAMLSAASTESASVASVL